jgi:hypothetical protein
MTGQEAIHHMRILVYKRTHVGDPDGHGRFGNRDCMGRVRDRKYDAVIGVGGIGREARRWGIDRKLNWVGLRPKWMRGIGGRAAVVTFEEFRRFEEQGPLLAAIAPKLAERMYKKGARVLLLRASDWEHAEAAAILRWSLRRAPYIAEHDELSRSWRCGRNGGRRGASATTATRRSCGQDLPIV